MIDTGYTADNGTYNGSSLAFSDEHLAQFVVNKYYDIESIDTGSSVRKAAQVKPGYWDQNVRNPGIFMPRDGGEFHRRVATGRRGQEQRTEARECRELE